MTETEFLNILNKYKQHHIIQQYSKISESEKGDLLTSLEGIDFDLTFKIYRDLSCKIVQTDSSHIMKPAPVIRIPDTQRKKDYRNKAKTIGEYFIRNRTTAVLIVAGGHGTRLDFEGPKGTFPVSPVRKKTLFQVLSESVLASSIRYNTTIPLLIMTSNENHQDTVSFFNSHDFFGLNKEIVRFFKQGRLPSITPEGKLVLKQKNRLSENPDGHGGSLKALYDTGLLQFLMDGGITDIFYCQVDNPLVKTVDPVFLGYHKLKEADISTKAVKRRNIEEKVGICVTINGKDTIIEYSDLKKEDMRALDDKGEILYWAGNTAIHILSLSFVKKLNADGFALPYHCAKKPIPAIREDGARTNVNGWKFETFVFDAIPLAEKACFMEIERDEEFSPVKNKNGEDSPETARRAMSNLHKGWLKETGIKVPNRVQVEISPLFALDNEELIIKLKGKGLEIKNDIYLG